MGFLHSLHFTVVDPAAGELPKGAVGHTNIEGYVKESRRDYLCLYGLSIYGRVFIYLCVQIVLSSEAVSDLNSGMRP